MKENNSFDIAVIGGGPAGMMAAGRAAELGAKVVLIEKNEILGKKLLLTGKGRCNFTHNELDIRKFAEKFGKNRRFLYSALSTFGALEVINFFESRGVKAKVEQGDRIFPENSNARDILNVLVKYLKEGKVYILLNVEVVGFKEEDQKISYVLLRNQKLSADKYILCTGGKSYPQTGSTGDGYRWAEQLGHTVIPPVPALNPVKTSESWVKELQGLSLKNVSLKLFKNGKKKDERFGEMLFTHFGISGPIVMDMSKNIGDLMKNGPVKLILDLKPALDFKKLDKRIQRDFQEFKGRMFKNSLKGLLPLSMIPVIIALSGIDPEKKVDYIRREERNKLVHLLKELELTSTGLLGFKWSVVTSGGVALKEVDPNTMGSKKIKNLYFAGEILDLDGPSGGYNLQECWSTGYLAGQNAAKH
ncbi:MAG TPA: aminoacetone oxidase family FAD-binding enzyme [Candidatus Atribacteria bacterium]|nr:aminoacetone oxidase family FAD-binding enzyme [Candidatus Atribacteria bacterium]